MYDLIDNKNNLIKVKKPTANLLYNITLNVYLLPSKLDLNNRFVEPYLVNIIRDGDFDNIVEQYE